jgi:hypothetical protein
VQDEHPDGLVILFNAAWSGEKPTQAGLTPWDRVLRLLAGSILFVLEIVNHIAGWYLLLASIVSTVL